MTNPNDVRCWAVILPWCKRDDLVMTMAQFRALGLSMKRAGYSVLWGWPGMMFVVKED